MSLATIRAAATAVGFPLVGCTRIEPLPRADFLARWLGEGRAGEMTYLERRRDVRIDPRRQFPWARSFIVVGQPYAPAPAPAGDWRLTLHGRIAAYAAGPDYHHDMRARLDRLAAGLAAEAPGARFRSYVDTGAMLEREWAVRAGLGWMGKHTLVLGTTPGSWFLIGELVTDLDVEPLPLPEARCGSCTRCVAACPTGALAGDYTMDPRRCLSYLTIEHRTAIPRALRPALGNWIFGCDLCQEACPWGDVPRADLAAAAWLHPSLPELLRLDQAGFARRFGHTAVARTKRRGLLRNVAVALGNSGNPDAAPPLAGALSDPEPLVRGHAAWALGRLGGAHSRRALERARAAETDVGARAEMEDALALR